MGSSLFYSTNKFSPHILCAKSRIFHNYSVTFIPRNNCCLGKQCCSDIWSWIWKRWRQVVCVRQKCVFDEIVLLSVVFLVSGKQRPCLQRGKAPGAVSCSGPGQGIIVAIILCKRFSPSIFDTSCAIETEKKKIIPSDHWDLKTFWISN